MPRLLSVDFEVIKGISSAQMFGLLLTFDGSVRRILPASIELWEKAAGEIAQVVLRLWCGDEVCKALKARLLSPALFHQVFPTQFCEAGRATSRIGPPGDAMWDGGVMRMSNEDGPGMPGRVAW